MSAEDRLVQWYYEGFWMFLGAIIGLAAVIVLSLVFRNRFVTKNKDTKISNKIVLYSIVSVIALLNVYCVYWFTVYCKDKKEVDSRQFTAVTVTVTGFTGLREGNSPQDPNYRFAVVERSGEQGTVKLNLKKVKIGETYDIIYLRNTRLAVVQG